MAPVAVRRKVPPVILEKTLSLANAQRIFCRTGSSLCRSYVLSGILVPVIHQCIVLRFTFAIYVVVAETYVLYKMISKAPIQNKTQCFASLKVVASGVALWAHVRTDPIPPFVQSEGR